MKVHLNDASSKKSTKTGVLMEDVPMFIQIELKPLPINFLLFDKSVSTEGISSSLYTEHCI